MVHWQTHELRSAEAVALAMEGVSAVRMRSIELWSTSLYGFRSSTAFEFPFAYVVPSAVLLLRMTHVQMPLSV